MRRSPCVRVVAALALALVAAPLAGSASAAMQESWDAVFQAGVKIGHVHTYIQPVKDKDRELLRVRVDMELNIKRGNDKSTIKLQYGTIETPDGSVLRLDTRTLVAENELRAFGDVVDDKMTLILDGGGQRQQLVIPWTADVRGPYAAEQSLSRAPIKAGEVRTLKMFMPDVNKVCEITLTAKLAEDVVLGDGRRPLLRVEQTTTLDGKPRPEFNVTLWVDSGGQVLKSATDNMGGMVTYRTTREGALAPSGSAGVDLIRTSIVKVTRKIPKPEATRNIRYRVALKEDDPAQILPADRRQTLQPGPNKQTSILDVRTAGPNDGPPSPIDLDPQYLRPNALITSADPTVMSLAARAVGNATDPWEKAKRVQHWVFENLKDKNFEVAFAPASEVAQNLKGDCTEHGVLTAAMCRAVGVPSRVVVGLIYGDSLGGFGFHLWNEVYVNRRWVAVDSAFDQSTVDAVHIKLAESSLDGVAPFEAFLPVVRVMGKMTLEPVEIR